MKIDVVIPVYKPGKELGQLLCMLKKQTFQPNKVILMHTEDGYTLSVDDKEKGEACIEEVMVTQAEYDHGGTRDAGIRHSDAEIVVCMTQDAVPQNEKLLERLACVLADDSEIAVAYSRQIAAADASVLEQYTRIFNYPEQSCIKGKADLETLGIKTYFCSNVCAAYRRSIYGEVGGFEQRIIFNEDMVFAAHAVDKEYKIAYVAEAVVIHSHQYSCLQLFKRNFDQGVSQADHPEIFAKVSSESEGMKLVKQTIQYLLKAGKPWLILKLCIQSGWKYAGYQLGKHYQQLPIGIRRRLTMNQKYWDRRTK